MEYILKSKVKSFIDDIKQKLPIPTSSQQQKASNNNNFTKSSKQSKTPSKPIPYPTSSTASSITPKLNKFHKSQTPNIINRQKSYTKGSNSFYNQGSSSASMSVISREPPRPLRHTSQNSSNQNTPTKFKQAGASIKRSFKEVMNKIKDITSDKIRPLISGKFNYKFRLQVQGYLMAQAYCQSKQHHQIAIPTKCKWYRVIRQRKYQVPCVGANIYQLSADDIGAKIQVKVDPLQDQEFSGSAFAEYGPISLTSMGKKRLEDIIAAGSCKFAVNVKKIQKKQKTNQFEKENNYKLESQRFNRPNNQSLTSQLSNYSFSFTGSPDYNGDQGSLFIQSNELKVRNFFSSPSLAIILRVKFILKYSFQNRTCRLTPKDQDQLK